MKPHTFTICRTTQRKKVLSGWIKEFKKSHLGQLELFRMMPKVIPRLIWKYYLIAPLQLKKIYTPRLYSDSEDDNICELDEEDEPEWRSYFESDGLLARYEPIALSGRSCGDILFKGKVLNKCTKLKPGTTISIRKLRYVFRTETHARRKLRELRILRILRGHNHILTLYDVIPLKNTKQFTSLSLITEFVGPSLSQIACTNQFFSAVHVQYILYQILHAVAYIHAADIKHCDLQPSNILIDEKCFIRISDFSSARHRCDSIADEAKSNLSMENREQCKTQKQKKKKMFLIRRSRQRVRVVQCYLAPEVILLQNDQAMDIWSIGAIFGELMQMQRENRPNPTKRCPLFSGEVLFSPSFVDPSMTNSDSRYRYQLDIMDSIFNVIGSPTEQEIQKITEEKAREYLRGLAKKKPRKLKRIFPGADKNALDLFEQLLKFDVDKRITLQKALKHPYLDVVYGAVQEAKVKPVAFSLEYCRSLDQMSVKVARELILEEVAKYSECD